MHERPEANADCVGAFESFLTTYESTTPDLTTDALENLNIEEEEFSDEYVMVDNERDGQKGVQRPDQPGRSKKKYMEMLQQVADRQISEVMIELDDLENVSTLVSERWSICANRYNYQYEKSNAEDSGLRLVESIERNAKHYIDILSQAVDKVMPKETKEIT